MNCKILILPAAFFLCYPLMSQTRLLIPDDSFGNEGLVKTTIYSPGYSYPQKLIMKEDGGFYLLANTDSIYDYHMSVLSYRQNGTLDSSFGLNGISILPFQSGFYREWAMTGCLTDDGIFVGGYAANHQGKYIPVVQKINLKGSPDTTWASKGRLIYPFGNEAWICGIYPTSQKGCVVFGGTSDTVLGVFTLKLDSVGHYDSSFGINGQKTYSFDAAVEPYNSAIDSKGRIYICGTHFKYSSPWIVRFGSDYVMDSSYGYNGASIFNNLDTSSMRGRIHNLSFLGNGDLLATGYIRSTWFDMASVYRIKQAGYADPVFGYNGRFMMSFHSEGDYGYAVSHNSNNEIYVLAETTDKNEKIASTILKLDSTGKKDVNFGTSGYLDFYFGLRYDSPIDMHIDSKDRILITGIAHTYNTLSSIYLARFNEVFTVGIPPMKTDSSLLLFPNPATNSVQLSHLNFTSLMPIHIRFYDMSGNCCLEKIHGYTGVAVSELQFSLAPGTYLVEATDGNTRKVQKLSIVSE